MTERFQNLLERSQSRNGWEHVYLKAVSWIRIGYNGDPDPPFYLLMQRAKAIRIHADPDPGQT
jgi:hypothetical protein